jgi:hypothetical protein
VHAFSFQTNYVADGNVTARRDIDATETLERWYFLSGVSVQARAPGGASAVVTLGDSITDGGSTTVDANRRWPDVLAERLRAELHTSGIGVLNQGMSGNRLLHDPNPPEGNPAEDYALAYPSFQEEIDQWTNVHGVSQTPVSTDSPEANWTRTRYGDAGDQAPVEAISIANTGHSLPTSGMAARAIHFFGLDAG